MPKFGDITNVWNTVRELNVGEIRESADQQVQLSIVGALGLRDALIRALYAGPSRYPASGRAALWDYDVPLQRERQNEIGNSDALLLALDAREADEAAWVEAIDKLAMLQLPKLAVVLDGSMLSARLDNALRRAGIVRVDVPDGRPETIAAQLGTRLAELLPDDLRIAAARKIPLLRDAVGRWLIGDVSFSNATYSFTSGIPEMIPFLSIPLNAADVLVLTKNQALLVYKLALAYGAPADFQAQITEVLPVIGAGFMWRQIARQLIGLIPVAGLVAKVAVSYAGTFATGQAAMLWYRNGEQLSSAALQKLYKQATAAGTQRARELIARRKHALPPPDTSPIDVVAVEVEPELPASPKGEGSAGLPKRPEDLAAGSVNGGNGAHGVDEPVDEAVDEPADGTAGRFDSIARRLRGFKPFRRD